MWFCQWGEWFNYTPYELQWWHTIFFNVLRKKHQKMAWNTYTLYLMKNITLRMAILCKKMCFLNIIIILVFSPTISIENKKLHPFTYYVLLPKLVNVLTYIKYVAVDRCHYLRIISVTVISQIPVINFFFFGLFYMRWIDPSLIFFHIARFWGLLHHFNPAYFFSFSPWTLDELVSYWVFYCLAPRSNREEYIH